MGVVRKAVTAFVLAGMLTTQLTEFVASDQPEMEYVGDYRVTAYAYYEGDGENYYTASGAEPTPYYTVATGDEFPFGTVLYIEGLGYAEVQDRGGFGPGIIDYHIGWDSMESFEDTTRAVYVVHY